MGRLFWRIDPRLGFLTVIRLVRPGNKPDELVGTGSHGCPVRNLGRLDRILAETYTRSKRLWQCITRPRRNARPLRQRYASCSRQLYLYRTIHSKLKVSVTIREVALDKEFGYLINSGSVRSLRSFSNRSTRPKLNLSSGHNLKNGR